VKPLAKRPGNLPARTRQLTSQACRRDLFTVHGLLSSGRHRRASSVGTGKLALKLGLCVCAGQLIAGPAFASAAQAAPVVQAAAVTTVTPKITESTNTRTISYGSSVKVTAKVVNPATGKAVTSGYVRLQAWRNHAWRTWQAKKLAKSGTITFTSTPHMTGGYRTQFAGVSGIKAANSKSITVTVRPRSSSGAKVLAEAKRHTGALYKYAAAGPKRFDCSGFTMYVYRKAAGKKLPHKANSQQRYGKAVSKSKKQIGDLIIFRSGSYGYHAAIYAGGGYMYDSPHSGARVGKHKIWSNSYVVRRLV
jgi:cell wall-associated NlpC family hydrolase